MSVKIKTFRALVSILFDNDKVETYKQLFSDVDSTERTFNAKLLHMYKNHEITEEALLDYLETTQTDVFNALSNH